MWAAAVWILSVGFIGLATYRKTLRDSARPAGGIAGVAETIAEAWIRASGWYPKLTAQLPQLIRYCNMAFPPGGPADPPFEWTVKTFARTVGLSVVAVAAALASADPAVAAALAIATAGVPVASWKELQRKAERRKEAFIAELPTFLHKLSLLMSAGETAHRAWQLASAAGASKQSHPLYLELARTSRDIEQGVPFPRALESLHRRCSFYEVGALVTTVLMNYKRGGESFALALQDAARSMMEKKHAIVRMKGERASAKLLFPMLLMLMAVMVIVAAPAVMIMNH